MTATTNSGAQAATATHQGILQADPRLSPLGFATKSAYGAGAAVESYTTAAITYFFFFYVTAVCGLSGTLAGFATFLALAVDAVADPAIGLWSDNSRSRFGRRHPFMLAGIVPTALAFGLIFSIPAVLSGWLLFAFVLGVSLIMRFSLSLWLLPYTALGAELSDDYVERSTIVAFRVFFGTIATFLCYGLALVVYLPGKTGVLNRHAYIGFGWTGAVVFLAAGLIATLGTRGVIARLHNLSPASDLGIGKFLQEVSEIFRNPSFVPLFLSVLIFFVAQGTAASLTVHAFNYFWAISPGALQATFLGLATGPIVGIPITLLLSRFLEKRTISIIGLVIFCTSQFLMPVAKIVGFLPTNPAALYAIIIGNAFVLGVMIAAVTIAFQSMLADAADEHEHLFGSRREGMFYAGLTLSAKAAGGMGAFIAGIALDVIHFPSNIAAQGAHLHLTVDTIRNLGIVYGPLPALMTLGGTLFMFRYRLTKARHADILRALAERREVLSGVKAVSQI